MATPYWVFTYSMWMYCDVLYNYRLYTGIHVGVLFYIGDTIGTKSSKADNKGHPSMSGKEGTSTGETTSSAGEDNAQCLLIRMEFIYYVIWCWFQKSYKMRFLHSVVIRYTKH